MRTLTALAAAFAPDRARALVARIACVEAEALSADAARLAARDRRERMAALSKALAAGLNGPPGSDPPGPERAPVAAVLRALRSGSALPQGASPALVRLCRERCR
jgi:hypothetical protein